MTSDPVTLINHVIDLLNKFRNAKGSFPFEQEDQVDDIITTLERALSELLESQLRG